MNTTVFDGEKLRLTALKEFQILDTLPEQDFDDITLLASQICETPIAAVSLIDEDRQWFKSRIGLSVSETPRNIAFCDHAIKGDDLFVVSDAAQDFRFSSNPLVTKDPHIRFYAGAPLTTSDGYKIGALCVIDQKPRQLSDAQERALNALARSVMTLIEARSLMNAADNSKNDTSIKQFSESEIITSKGKSFFTRYLKHYLVATLIIAAFTLAKLVLGSVTQIESPYLLFAGAILLAAWRGGFGAGLYATLATVLVINYLFLPPYGSLFSHGFKQNLLYLLFIGQGVFISLMCASRLRNERLLYQAGKELENRVTNRTNQLAQANNELKQEIEERNLLQEDLRRARDSALESARLKSEFLANMSHEIRTPMNGVIGMTGLLLETDLDKEQKRFAKIIRSSGESLLTIINDILDFSKVEAGKLELETLDFNLRDTIESLIEMFSNRAQEQKNELAALINSDVPLFLRGDAGRIRQVLTNLIGNAIKFTKDGKIVVRIKKVRETSDRVQLKFSVTDTGEGISGDVQSKLFQPFTQSDASTTRRFGGTGLGLSISKKLIEMMNGEIGVESEIGKGSTFWFDITLEKQKAASFSSFESSKPFEFSGRRVLIVDNNEVDLNINQNEHYADFDIHITATAEAINFSPPTDSSKRILIVEDNTVNQLVAKTMLKKFGYHTDVAANGLEALKALEIIPYDLVLMDCQMPEMDGYEATRAIRSRDWKTAQIPIIALTAHVTTGEREKCLAAGMDDYISKPIEKENLRRTVAQWLAKSEETDSSVNSMDNSKVEKENSAESVAELSLPAVDLATLNEITDNDTEMRREIVEIYLSQTAQSISEMEQVIDENNALRLYEIAHKLVGGSSICGMKAIVAPLRKLEQLGREEKTDEAFPYFVQVQNAFAAIDKECRKLLDN
jgi:signal transduction histidine kinase/CheY-like chemotaxis protein/HPt (histidine-containing phosphotransfer) domain-containing protein